MRTYRLLFLLLGLLLITPAHAQENLPTPLDPAQIFSDVVEVVETLPLYIAERDRVSFYNYDTGEWHTYPFPDFPLREGEIAAAAFGETPQGEYMLSVEYYTPCTNNCPEIGDNSIDYIPPHAATVRERWHFDRDTGEFTPFEAICGGYARALPEEGEWVTFSSNSETYLCNTETGQTSAPLPDDIRTTPLLNSPSLSADERWLVFTFYYSLDVFAYDFVQSALTLLGSMTSNSPFFSLGYPRVDWIDGQHIILENPTRNEGGPPQEYLYRAALSQAGSLELVYHSNRRSVLRLENPIRFVWVGRQFDDTPIGGTPPPPEEDCIIHEYNPMDSTITSYTIDGECSYNSLLLPSDTSFSHVPGHSPDNRLLLITNDAGTLDIQNLETGEITTIAQTPNGEMISANWYADGLLTVTVWQEGQTLGRWRVRVHL